MNAALRRGAAPFVMMQSPVVPLSVASTSSSRVFDGQQCACRPWYGRRRHVARPGMSGFVQLMRRADVPKRWHYRATGSGESTTEDSLGRNLKQTMADLDSILGIEEEEEEEEEAKEAEVVHPAMDSSIKDAVLEQAEKIAEDTSRGEESKRKIYEELLKVVESATRMADDAEGEKDIREKIESLIQTINPEGVVTKGDIRTMKEQVFGATTFWVTEIIPSDNPEKGVIVRGNMRGDKGQLFSDILRKLKDVFGDKYEAFLVEDMMVENPGDDQTPRVAIQIMPAAQALPQETASWQLIVTIILLILTFGSSVQLGLVANIGKLPKETIDWLAQPENFNAEVLPPGLSDFSLLPFLLSSLPITATVMTLQFVHEAGHRAVAYIRKLKLGPAFFIPNSQLGTFGTITQLKSLAKNRTELWDFAFGGPALGGLASLVVLVTGIFLALDPNTPRESLVPVPTVLLQGSLLLGSFMKLVLGQQATSQPEVLLHPLTIAGWCGLTTTALNLLPVGTLDGGRLMQSAYGQRTLNITSLFTYAGLGLGLLGSSLSLPFGLYVLICQRNAEQYVQDTVTPPPQSRQTITAAMALFAVLVLLPMAPFSSSGSGVSGGMMM